MQLGNGFSQKYAKNDMGHCAHANFDSELLANLLGKQCPGSRR